MTEPSGPSDLSDAVTADGVFHAVQDGYTAVYDALPNGPTFNRIWRDNAYGREFPVEFAHIGFLTVTEATRMLDLLRLQSGDVLVDLACGAGGPGLWAAPRPSPKQCSPSRYGPTRDGSSSWRPDRGSNRSF